MMNCKCGGSGIVEKDGKLFECICALLRRRAQGMPPFIRMAELRPEHTNHKLHDKTKKSLFISATWQDMKAIVKAVMIRHLNLFVRVTSDNDVLHAYVGAMSKKSKGENEATFETVGDFIGPPELAIIRLNALTRPNKAAAGALEEAVICRMDQDKPVWLISDIERPFTSTSPAYSESLWDLVDTFEKVRVPPILSKNTPTGVFDVDILQSPSEETPEPVVKEAKPAIQKKAPKPKPAAKEENVLGADLSVYGEGIKKSRNFNRE